MNETIITIIQIFIGALLAELACGFVLYMFKAFFGKDKKLEIGCDYCENIKKRYRTPDRLFLLCKLCMEGYLDQHEFSDEEKAKVRRKYKQNRRSK